MSAFPLLPAALAVYQAPRIVDCRGMHASEWRPDLGYWVCARCGVALDEKRRPGGLDGHWVSAPVDDLRTETRAVGW